MNNESEKAVTEEKENGRIYTPDYIVNAILDLSGYRGNAILKKHVIDNSCGDGAFLCEIVRRYCKEALSNGISVKALTGDLKKYIHGIEIKKSERDKCVKRINDIASSFGANGVEWDILCDDALTVNKYNSKMDYVLGNPPYVRVHNFGDNSKVIKDYSFAQNGMTDLFMVFYEIGIKMLSQNGVLGYITPSSFFNSLAGEYMRKTLISAHMIDKIVDLKHYQAFSSTAYTAITILKSNKTTDDVKYYRFDENNKTPCYVETLAQSDFYISGDFYFAEKSKLSVLSKIYSNDKKCDISVKNGYATLCDDVFINDFNFDSRFIIPVVKASKGEYKKIFFPYGKDGCLLDETVIKTDDNIYGYLLDNKDRLIKRSNEKDKEKYWYAFGRSQAIKDTYKDKLAINTLLRDETDFKFVDVPAGTGVYSGLYLVSESIPFEEIKNALKSKEFAEYISLLGKYKSGGYYTFSSKDVKAYLDYKFADRSC